MQSVKAVAPRVALSVLFAVGGCYWSRYPEVMETHLELLDQYARKLESLSTHGRGVAIEDWGEFVYPLERGRDFARIAARRYPDLGSLERFRGVLDRYAELVDDPAVLAARDGTERIRADVAALQAAITSTRRALAREQAA